MGIGARHDTPGFLRLVPSDANPDNRPGKETVADPAPRQTLDDHTLVEAARAGNPGVASLLCDRMWPQVDRTIRRLVGAHDSDRDDLAQLAMIELVGSIGRYRAECSLDTWAQAVTANVVFRHLRRRRVERRIFSDILIDDDTVGVPVHYDRRSASREVLGRIGKHLDGMNESRAWAYVLHDLYGYDLREVGQMTNSSVSAAQSRLVRGRRDLHDRIAQDPELADALRDVEAER
jgi:RNA polymerase sigma-70 factor (ECF subfamily)